jgi:hypothetical protein
MNFNIDCDSNSRPLVWEHGGAHSFRLADTRRVLSMAPTVIWEFSTNRSRCPDIRRQNRSSLPSSCLNCPEFAVAYPSRKPSRVPWSPIFPKLLLIAFVIHRSRRHRVPLSTTVLSVPKPSSFSREREICTSDTHIAP